MVERFSMGNLAEIFPVVLVGLVIWLAGLSIAFYFLLSHYKRLGKKAKEGNLIKILDKVLKQEEENKKNIKKINQEVEQLNLSVKSHIQKYGLVRFNPFNETGGDQSFSLSLLDKNDNGFVITCLHTRDRTRVYAKPVTSTKSDYDLSKEEQKAIKKASQK
jgi:hypothetical protein